MANNYFQFRQFTVQQEYCAMKVCTDSCVFGAYLASHLSGRQAPANHILDIGTGTGLLSLMIAQKTTAIIDAVEIDTATSRQAMYNFQQSPWKSRLNIVNADVLDFSSDKKYDCIISNPPFYEGDLTSGNKKKDAAKHGTSLTLKQLLQVVDKNLSPDGFFAVLVPFNRAGYFIEMAEKSNYFLEEQVSVRHTENLPFSRALLFFVRNKATVANYELVIKKGPRYTPEFTALLTDFYLDL